MRYLTEEEKFWKGEFGDEYIGRNRSAELHASNLSFFSKVFHLVNKPSSILEFGANIGMNLKALRILSPSIKVHGVEINASAAAELGLEIGVENVSNCSIFDFDKNELFDLTLVKGLLIHINPDLLPLAYEQLFRFSTRYILICEYYNPSPVMITYRGHGDRLYKRDFAGEILQRFNSLRLIDYGFIYHRDAMFALDDVSWFLLEKDAL